MGGFVIFLHHVFQPAGHSQFPYKSPIGRVGYYLHVIPGLLFFFAAAYQFLSPARIRWPRVHHYVGYTFTASQLVSTIGIWIIMFSGSMEAGPVGATSSFFMVIYWQVTLWFAIRAAMQRNIELHNIWIVRNVFFAFGIIWTRPGVLIAQAISPMLGIEKALGMALVWVMVGMWLAGEWWVYVKYGEGVFRTRYSSIIANAIFPPRVPSSPAYVPLPHNIDASKDTTSATTTIALNPAESASASPIAYPPRVLDPWTPLTLTSKTELTPHTILYRFQLPHSQYPVIIPPGRHLTLRVRDTSLGVRSYTPISNPVDAANGTFDFLISVRRDADASKSMSNHLKTLEVGSDVVEMTPPQGSFNIPSMQPHILLVAGGSGLTPMLSILTHLLPSPTCPSITLLYAASTTPPPLDEHLTQLAERYGNVFTYIPTLKVSEKDVMDHLPDLATAKEVRGMGRERWSGERAAVLVCGPPGLESNVVGWAKKGGLSGDLCWAFGRDGR
ncbi:NADH-cytochrome b5 reductase [Rhizophlyctis rosea]|nr:NADH-cytochrome b5 reductase [Rhizophlyctis rosea]